MCVFTVWVHDQSFMLPKVAFVLPPASAAYAHQDHEVVGVFFMSRTETLKEHTAILYLYNILFILDIKFGIYCTLGGDSRYPCLL